MSIVYESPQSEGYSVDLNFNANTWSILDQFEQDQADWHSNGAGDISPTNLSEIESGE
jgi:hypothetical protein